MHEGGTGGVRRDCLARLCSLSATTVISYPIDNVLPKLKEALRDHNAVVLHAPPGAGKTTRVPLALLETLTPAQGRIVMLEPRRIAAVSAARWMAKAIGEEAGGTVGYAIRFDAKKSGATRLEVVTEGILTRRLQADPALEGTAMVIFDEFHERGIHTDLALALCLDVRQVLRPDLKILVMSATMDCGPIRAVLGGAPVVASVGKAFPVEERYLADTSGPLPVRIVRAVRKALREAQGDILVFLPGAGEIRACAKELREMLDAADERVELHPLYGDLPFEDQERAIIPSQDRRKIVLATNIAETSLTIQGVQIVIDSGLTRILRHDPATGMNRLVTVPVSRASAEQRKGRAGRMGPGKCYRLYGSHELAGMPPFAQPEIMASDLSQLALELALWGVKDPSALSWLDSPPRAAWDAGLRLLVDLGAVDRDGSITPAGRAMARLPLHPRLGRLMIRAQELGCLGLGADLAALLTERDIFRHSPTRRTAEETDLSERIETLKRRRDGEDIGEAADPAALRAVERTSKQLLRLMPGPRPGGEEAAMDRDELSRLLLAAFPDRICKRREEGGGRYVHVQGRGVRLSPESHLVSSPYIIAVSVDAGEKTEGFVHIGAPVTEQVIRDECGRRIETVRRVEWDRKENRIASAVEERVGALLLSKRPFIPADGEAIAILLDVVRTNPSVLTMDREVGQFQARVGLLRRVFPGPLWPDLTDERLFTRPEEWLPPWLSGIRSAQALSGLNVLAALRAMLTRDQIRMLDELAPASIPVPSGRRIALDYGPGNQPVLSVQLQEMFGLGDTPVIAAGRVKVLLHLLSPARRPVQITQDLKGFWNSAYQQVKKDLKGRYPKHSWPDEPWNALPTRRAKPHRP